MRLDEDEGEGDIFVSCATAVVCINFNQFRCFIGRISMCSSTDDD